MSVSSYALGVARLLLLFVPMGLAAVCVRRWLFPGLKGFVATLATLTLGLAGIFAVAQLLGSVGLFRRWPFVAICAASGTILALVARGRSSTSSVGDQPPNQVSLVLVALLTAFVLSLWSLGTFVALNSGPVESDTQTYHLPHAARFVQDGSLTDLHYVIPDNAIPFHPSNAEVLQAVAILTLGTDMASIFMNLIWALLTVLAAWAIGARWGHGAPSAVGIAFLFVTPVMSSTQAGSAMTDATGLFFFLSAVAFLVNDSPRSLMLGGLAAGLALSTKLTFVAPIGLLTLVVVTLAVRRARILKDSLSWLIPMAATGGFWYIRNALHTGNPIPSLQIGFGEHMLPKVPMKIIDRYGFSVADYAFEPSVWRRTFLPGLVSAFGVAGVLVIAAAVAALFVILVGNEGLSKRLLAAVSLLSGIAYALTPTTALGPRGEPSLFTVNLRYAMPALALALIMAPRIVPRSHRRGILIGIPAIALLTVRIPEWPPETRSHLPKGIVIFVSLSALILLWARSDRTHTRFPLGALALACLTILVVGYPLQQRYLAKRYSPAGGYPANGTWNPAPFLWARTVRDARIGFAGFFTNYPLYGLDLSNAVTYVGDLRSSGEFTDHETCRGWRLAVDAGSYDYLVLMPAFEDQPEPPQLGWTQGSSNAEEILKDNKVRVFRVNGPLDASGCH